MVQGCWSLFVAQCRGCVGCKWKLQWKRVPIPLPLGQNSWFWGHDYCFIQTEPWSTLGSDSFLWSTCSNKRTETKNLYVLCFLNGCDLTYSRRQINYYSHIFVRVFLKQSECTLRLPPTIIEHTQRQVANKEKSVLHSLRHQYRRSRESFYHYFTRC